MEFNTDTATISIQRTDEYLVVRHGLGLGIDMLSRYHGGHPAFSVEAVQDLQERFNTIPIIPESLPFSISTLEGRLALCGLSKARAPERPQVREKRQDIVYALRGILETAGVCFNSANG